MIMSHLVVCFFDENSLALSWMLKPALVSGSTVFRGSGTSTDLMPSFSALPTSAGGVLSSVDPAILAPCRKHYSLSQSLAGLNIIDTRSAIQ